MGIPTAPSASEPTSGTHAGRIARIEVDVKMLRRIAGQFPHRGQVIRGLTVRMPVMLVDRRTFDPEGNPIERWEPASHGELLIGN